MKKKNLKLTLWFFLILFLVINQPLFAVPTFQVAATDGFGGSFGEIEDTWIITDSSFDLTVVGSYQASDSEGQKETESLASKGKMGFNEKREFGLLEVEIPKLEKRKAELTSEMEAVVDDHEKLMEISANFQKVSDELEEKEMRWLELSELD